jgi:hypothetical protein
MVLLVSSLYCKLVLLFLIYNILTFDQKKKRKKKELSVDVLFKGACSLCLYLYDFCIASFQLVLQACLALFDLYNSYI